MEFFLYTLRQKQRDNQRRRLGPAQIEETTYISYSQSQETSLTTHAQQGSLEVKRGERHLIVSDVNLAIGLFAKSPSWLKSATLMEGP